MKLLFRYLLEKRQAKRKRFIAERANPAAK